MLHPLRLGLAGGIFFALFMFIFTLLAANTGYAQEYMESMISLYPGYGISNEGSIIGLIYGFISGFLFLYILAWLYNMLCCCCKNKCEK